MNHIGKLPARSSLSAGSARVGAAGPSPRIEPPTPGWTPVPGQTQHPALDTAPRSPVPDQPQWPIPAGRAPTILGQSLVLDAPSGPRLDPAPKTSGGQDPAPWPKLDRSIPAPELCRGPPLTLPGRSRR